MNPICPYCGGVSVLRDSSAVYKKSYGPIYLCSNYPTCDSYVGVHKGTTIPKGRMANKELRDLKVKTHSLFDPLWRSRQMSRDCAYRLLEARLGIPPDQCHIGMFDEDTCRRAITMLEGIHRERTSRTE